MTPLPGISATVVNDEGVRWGKGEGGYLIIDRPWPGMLRTIFGDDERYQDTYWSRFAGAGLLLRRGWREIRHRRGVVASGPGR